MKLPIQAQPILRNVIQANSLNQGVIPSECTYAGLTYSTGSCMDQAGERKCCLSDGTWF